MQIPAVYTESGVPNSVFLYFSYTTLTTTGYGEILPVHALARTMVIIEQLIGVLYPVVLIGRLVSLVAGKPEASDEGKRIVWDIYMDLFNRRVHQVYAKYIKLNPLF